MKQSNWICCQIGAREHYAIPRALNKTGMLECLFTDAWLTSVSNLFLGNVHGLKDRYHAEIPADKVRSFTSSLLMSESKWKFQNLTLWALIMRRNAWFQSRTIKSLNKMIGSGKLDEKDITLFSYSYAAKDLFEFAKKQGWRTVLGQIDPGPYEEAMVRQLHDDSPEFGGVWSPAPVEYWELHKQEWNLADTVIVNSEWSRKALQTEGFDTSKVKVVPLVYEANEGGSFIREYPNKFTSSCKLKVLFLGQVLLRKGIKPLLEAAKLLENAPVEFNLIGPLGCTVPDQYQGLANVNWIGAVPRSEIDSYYQNSDVFILPTFSDGFALTQLEAQQWQLPVIASKFCGSVVEHGVNGWLLEEVTATEISDALCHMIKLPHKLKEMAAHSKMNQFNTTGLANWLETIE